MEKELISKLDEVQKEYPYLKRIYFPFKCCFPIILEGYLVNKQDCELYKIKNNNEASLVSFYARIYIPENYKKFGISVYDLNKKIDTEFIIKNYYSHAHFNSLDTPDGTLLCTHILEDILGRDNLILDIINSAHFLYLNYLNLLNGNKFNMDEYSHGRKGYEEYINERKRFYGKGQKKLQSRNGKI